MPVISVLGREAGELRSSSAIYTYQPGLQKSMTYKNKIKFSNIQSGAAEQGVGAVLGMGAVLGTDNNEWDLEQQ